MIAFGLVCVGNREIADGFIELVARSEDSGGHFRAGKSRVGDEDRVCASGCDAGRYVGAAADDAADRPETREDALRRTT